MSANDVDDYLAGLDEPHRSTLERLRSAILAAAPDAEEGMSYGAPAFRIGGKTVAGFSAATDHVSYLPHSGDVIAAIGSEEFEPFSVSKGAVRMPVDTPLPDDLVRRLIAVRRREAGV